MNIGINASFLRKPGNGIGEVTAGFVRTVSARVAAGTDQNTYLLYVDADVVPDLPCALPEGIRVVPLLPPYRRDDLIRKVWWELWTLPRRVVADGCTVLLSLAQSATVAPRRVRHVMVVHDLIPRIMRVYCNNIRKRIDWALTERGIRHADHIVAVSRRTEKDLIALLGLPADRITVGYLDTAPVFATVPSDAHMDAVLHRYGITRGYIYAGGGLDIRKNAEATLVAYARLRAAEHAKPVAERMTVPPLVVSGRLLPQLAPLVTDVARRVRELDIAPHTHILGFVPQQDLPALYRGAAVFVYPSLYEGFGLPVLEAMRMGTPVVTGKTSSLPEVGGDAVLYCDPYDVDDVARTIRTVLTQPDIRRTLHHRGPERAVRFSWARFADAVMTSLE